MIFKLKSQYPSPCLVARWYSMEKATQYMEVCLSLVDSILWLMGDCPTEAQDICQKKQQNMLPQTICIYIYRFDMPLGFVGVFRIHHLRMTSP